MIDITNNDDQKISSAELVVSSPLSQTEDARRLESRLKDFTKQVAVKGRSQLTPTDVGLQISDPERYRYELLEKVATDTKKVRSLFGENYNVALVGVDRCIKWRRINASEFEIYLEYWYAVVPPLASMLK